MKPAIRRSCGDVRRIAVNRCGTLLSALFAIGLVYASPPGLDEGMAAYQRGDYQTALRELLPLAERGVPEAQFALGVMYSDGQGVPANPSEAMKWIRRAAEQGLADAQLSLGSNYYLGLRVPEDDAEAAKWYRRAADQGNPVAQHNLASMYSVGRGVVQDHVLAYMWCTLSANQRAEGEMRDRALRKCDRIVPQMTKGEVAKAKELASKFVPRQEHVVSPPSGTNR